MYSAVPAYTEISHFRAPYKNAVISGFGQEAAASSAPDPASAFLMTDERGYRMLKPEIHVLFMEMMANAYGAETITADRIKISPVTPEQAASGGVPMVAPWMKKAVNDGKAVFANQALVFSVLGGTAIPSGVDEIGSAKAGSEAAKASAKDYGLIVLAGDPDKDISGGSKSGNGAEEGFMAGLGPAGVAALAAAVVGGGYVLYQSSKKPRRR